MTRDAPVHETVGSMSAVKFALARLYMGWSVSGPTLEASTAMAAMAQEEAGHARAARRFVDQSWDDSSCPIPCLAEPVATWPDLIALAGVTEVALGLLLERLMALDDSGVEHLVAKMLAEERYHQDFFRGWSRLLADNPSAAGRRFRDALSLIEGQVVMWQAGLPALRTPVEPVASGTAPTPRSLMLELVEGGGASPTMNVPRCPHCGNEDAELVSSFGPSLMTSQVRCGACGAHYEAVRCSPLRSH